MFLAPHLLMADIKEIEGKLTYPLLCFLLFILHQERLIIKYKGGDTGRVNNLTKTEVFHGQIRCVRLNHYLS